MNKLKVFESFSGVGSQRMALRNIGCNFEVVGISEVDKNALLAYDAIHENQKEEVEIKSKEDMLFEMREANIAYNFSTGKDEMPRSENDIRRLYIAHKRSKNYGDITKINTDNLPDFDFFTYSFPCKNISIAGNQAGLEKGSGTQSSLVWECERIIKDKTPKYLMMENVKNICGKLNMATFQEWIDLLSELGYKSYWKVLNGKDYGVPQNRERVIMLSVLNGENDYNFPIKRKLNNCLKDVLEECVDEKYYIDESKFIETVREYPYSPILEENSKLLQVGYLDIAGNESNKRVYSENGLCPTLNSMNGGNRQPKIRIRDAQDKYHIKKLTPLECWRVMGFSDKDFYKAKNIAILSDSKLYERAGRGIVVPMLEDCFKELFKEYIEIK